MVDFNKPVRTRSGKRVTILATDMRKNIYPVLGIVHHDDGDKPASWTEGGRFEVAGTRDMDLANVPEKRRQFVNVYPSDELHADYGYPSRQEADRNAGTGRVRCLEIPYEV